MWSHIGFCGSRSGSGSGQNRVAPCGSGSGSGSGQAPGNSRGVKFAPKFLESSLERTMLLATGNGINAIFYSQKRKCCFQYVSKPVRSGSKIFIWGFKQSAGFKYPLQKKKNKKIQQIWHTISGNGPKLQKLPRERTHVRSEDPSERCSTDLHSRAFKAGYSHVAHLELRGEDPSQAKELIPCHS